MASTEFSRIEQPWQEQGHTIEVPSDKSSRLNILGLLSRKHTFEAWTFEASINSDVVIACLDAFCQHLTKETVVVVDRDSFHTSHAVADKLSEREA